MKKICSLFLVLMLAFSMLLLPCNAAAQEDTEIIYLEDGGYLVISSVSSMASRSTSSISGYKTAKRYDANDELQWTYMLNATFHYTPGVEAACTSTTCSVIINKSSWSCASKSSTYSGDTAYGEASMKRKVLFVVVETIPVSISITCDINGNLT